MGNYSTSSGVQTASAQISTNPGSLSGVDMTPPDDCSGVLTIYDSEDSNTSGKLILAEFHLDAGFMSLNHEYFRPVAVNRGIYATFTFDGTQGDSNYVVRYTIG